MTPVRGEPNEDTLQVEYHVFDVVNYELSFEERMTIQSKGQDVFIPTIKVNSDLEADKLYVFWISQGYEGMMYRLGDCPYTVPKQKKVEEHYKFGDQNQNSYIRLKHLSDQDNRVWHLLKRKNWQDDEFECMGVEEGEGKYKGTTGALIYRYKDGKDLFDKDGKRPTVSSGLTDAQRDFFFSNPPIGKLIKVQYLVLSSDGIPLNPSIIAIL